MIHFKIISCDGFEQNIELNSDRIWKEIKKIQKLNVLDRIWWFEILKWTIKNWTVGLHEHNEKNNSTANDTTAAKILIGDSEIDHKIYYSWSRMTPIPRMMSNTIMKPANTRQFSQRLSRSAHVPESPP